MILTDLRRKIKSSCDLLDKRDVYMAILIILTAIAAYLLGMLSAWDSGSQPVTVSNSAAVIEAAAAARPVQKSAGAAPIASPGAQGSYVASKSGTKYHLPSCPGAQRIAEANKVWFATKAEAERAGYAPAANCPGI